MKIGILTYYGVHNHGAVLQANALRQLLLAQGHEVTFLQFQRNYDMLPLKQVRKYKLGFSSIPFYLRYMCEKGLGNVVFNLKKRKALNLYRRENLPLSGYFSDFTGDLVIIGSDEVFSCEVGFNPFFYGYGIKAARIISYAGSFGPTTMQSLDDNNFKELISAGFEKFDQIGVRDENSKEIVESLSNKSAALVCDPVILYGYETEQRLFSPRCADYIVIYAYDRNMNDTLEISKIKEYANKYNLSIYSVGYYHRWCDKNINVSPDELLGYIRNAKLVITDTFHGAVMSLICGAQFVVKLRGNQNKLRYLMQEYGVLNRVISDFCDLESVTLSSIDYKKVGDLIEQRRAESMGFLSNALGDQDVNLQ